MKKLFTTSLFVLAGLTLVAQNGTVSGKVTDAENGDAVTGVRVVQEGATSGVITRADGTYSLSVPAGERNIIFTIIGYKTETRAVTVAGGETLKLDVQMAASSFIGDEVVVTASRRVEKVTNAPATLSVINSRAISELPSFNVAELLGRQRGVDYVRAGVLGVGINVRGFNSAFNPKNLQINDGRLSTLIATGLPLGALSTTVKEDVDRIEVILGPSSALYGPNAHNGLLNTLTKDPRSSEGTTMAVGIGNQSVRTGRFRHAAKVNDWFAWKFSGEYTEGEEFDFTDTVYSVAAGVELAKYPEAFLNRDFNSLRGEAGLYFSVNDKSDIIVGYGSSNSNNIGNTNAGRNQIRDWRVHWGQIRFVSPRFYANVYHTWSKTDSTYAMNRRTLNYWSYKNAKNPDGTAKFDDATARAKSLASFWLPNAALPDGGLDLARGALFQDDSRRLNGEAQYNNSAGKLFDYIVGAQFQQDVAASNNTYLLDNGDNITIAQYGGYVQLERKFGNLRAVAAARADNHDLYGFNFIPKAALVYATKNGAARITYGKGISSPTILNLEANIFGGLLLGNSKGFTVTEVDVSTQTVVGEYEVQPLKVEQIQTFELGYKGLFGDKLFFDANAYYNISQDFLSPSINIAPDRDFTFDHDNNPATAPQARIRGYATKRGDQAIGDLTATTPLPNGDRGADLALTYVNFGKVNTYGFDASVSYAFLDALSATVNYSYFGFNIDETDLANDGNKDGLVNENDLPINTPEHKLGLGLNYSKNKVFGSVFGRWVQEYDFFSGINVAAKTNESLIYGGNPVIENKRVGTSFNNGPLGGFFNVDFSLGYRLTNNFTISGQVVNLFDSEVREFVASPAISRLYSVELKVDLPASGKK